MIHITYRRKEDQKLCEDTRHAVRKIGPIPARELAKLINAIYSSSDLTDIDHMPQYRLHQLKGNKKDLYSLSIKEGYRIEFYPQDEQKNTLISGTNETEMFQKTKNIHIVAITKHYE